MTKAEIYNNIVQSVVKFCIDFIADNGLTADDNYIDWDSHAEIHELPDATVLVGPAGIGLSHDERFLEVIFSVGVCTNEDKNLFRLRDLTSKLYGLLMPESRVTIYDATTAQPVSWMITAPPVAVTPITKAELRSLQFVQVRALVDPAALAAQAA